MNHARLLGFWQEIQRANSVFLAPLGSAIIIRTQRRSTDSMA